MCGNNCTFLMVASMTAEATNQRAVLRNPGVIAMDSTPLYIPKNRFSVEKPALIRSRSKVEGRKWLICSPKSSSDQRWNSRHIHQRNDVGPSGPLNRGLVRKRHRASHVSLRLAAFARIDADASDRKSTRL